MSDLYLIFKNMMRKKGRLFLTFLSLFISFQIFSALLAFEESLNAGVDVAAANRLVSVNKLNFTQPLPYSYYSRVKSVEGVKSVMHLNWFGGFYQDPRQAFAMFAISQDDLFDVYPELVLPEDQKKAFLSNRQALLIGEDLANLYGLKVGQRIPINSNIFTQKNGSQTWDFDLVGIFKGATDTTNTTSAYFHFDYFNETKSFGANYIGFLAITTDDQALNDQVITAIDDQFANTPFETETVTEEAFAKSFIEQVGNIGLIISAVVGAALFTSLFVVGNVMVQTVRERAHEIAVMKALGFSAKRVCAHVLGEALFVCLWGGGMGLLAAVGLMEVAASDPNTAILHLTISSELAAKVLAVAALMGLVTGLLPAISAYRQPIIRALAKG